MSTADQWITRRLPRNASFTKHGVTVAVADAVTAALADASDVKELALADLLEQLASNVTWHSERQGEWAGVQSNLLKQAEYWRGRADGAAPGTLSFVDIDHGDALPDEDEWSST